MKENDPINLFTILAELVEHRNKFNGVLPEEQVKGINISIGIVKGMVPRLADQIGEDIKRTEDLMAAVTNQGKGVPEWMNEKMKRLDRKLTVVMDYMSGDKSHVCNHGGTFRGEVCEKCGLYVQ